MTSWAAPGDLVRERDDGRRQLVAVRIALAPQVQQNVEAGGTDGDVGRPAAPRAPEGIAHDNADVAAGQLSSTDLRRSAEASGSRGRRTSVPTSGAFERPRRSRRRRSRVRLGDEERPRVRTMRFASRRITSISAASPSPASARALGGGLDVVQPHDRPSIFEIAFSTTTRMSGHVASARSTTRRAKSSPSRSSGSPRSGEIASSVTARRREDRRDLGSGG